MSSNISNPPLTLILTDAHKLAIRPVLHFPFLGFKPFLGVGPRVFGSSDSATATEIVDVYNVHKMDQCHIFVCDPLDSTQHW